MVPQGLGVLHGIPEPAAVHKMPHIGSRRGGLTEGIRSRGRRARVKYIGGRVAQSTYLRDIAPWVHGILAEVNNYDVYNRSIGEHWLCWNLRMNLSNVCMLRNKEIRKRGHMEFQRCVIWTLAAASLRCNDRIGIG